MSRAAVRTERKFDFAWSGMGDAKPKNVPPSALNKGKCPNCHPPPVEPGVQWDLTSLPSVCPLIIMATKTAQPAQPVAAEQAPLNLSLAIAQKMDKKPDEQVKCVRVYGDRYRCNWWVQGDPDDWRSFGSGRISRSSFIRATLVGEKLVIEDLSITR